MATELAGLCVHSCSRVRALPCTLLLLWLLLLLLQGLCRLGRLQRCGGLLLPPLLRLRLLLPLEHRLNLLANSTHVAPLRLHLLLGSIVVHCARRLGLTTAAVGSASSVVVLHRSRPIALLLAVGARIVICGTASISSWDPPPLGPRVERHILVKRARMTGFLIFDYQHRYEEAIARLAVWVREGRLHYREDIADGLEHCPGAIAELYRGENLGKRLIRLPR